MNYPINWHREQVREVFTTESRQKRRDLFLRTHSRFRRIKVDFCKEARLSGFVTEDEVRELIESGPLKADNRLFFVVGEAGSGKSELCQWLEYSADRDRCVPVHVPRRMTTAAQVGRLLHNAISAGNDAIVRRAPLVRQAQLVALTAVVLLYERAVPTLSPASRWEEALMSASVRALIEQHLDAQIGAPNQETPLDPQEVLQLCLKQGIDLSIQQLAETVSDLSALLKDACDQVVWVGDVRATMSKLSDEAVANGRRPLLLLEDVTAFQFLGDLLLDYLLDLTSGHFDAVIGVTSGFERTQLGRASISGDLTHIHQRLRARFVLSDDLGRSYGLAENLLDFAQAYLDAIRDPSVSCGASEAQLASFGIFYPFTATSLQRAFEALHEEGNPKQTPRLFVEHVLGMALADEAIPPLVFDRSMYLRRPPDLFRADQVPDPRLQSILRWYGEVDDEVVRVDSRIPTAWGIPVPGELQCDGILCVPRTYVAKPTELRSSSANWQDELRELQHWLGMGGLYPKRETLKRGVEAILLSLGDPRSLGSRNALSMTGMQIWFARGDERLPIHLEDDSGDMPGGANFVKVRVTRRPAERAILEELGYLALSGASPAEVCENLATTLAWAQQQWDNFHNEVEQLFAQRLGVEVPQFILLLWSMICGLCGRRQNDLRPFDENEEGDGSYAAISPWSAIRHGNCYNSGEVLFGWRETARRLFIGRFTLRDTLLDRSAYETALQGLDTLRDLRLLSKLPLRALRGLPFRLRPGSPPLYDLLVPMQRYAAALVSLDSVGALAADLNDLDQRLQQVQQQLSEDTNSLSHQVALLRLHCGAVGVTWRDSWDAPLKNLTSLSLAEYRNLHEELRELRDAAYQLNGSSPNVWEYTGLRHKLVKIERHPYWLGMLSLGQVREELLRIAHSRYRRGGKTLIGTEAYRQLLGTIKDVRQELSDDH